LAEATVEASLAAEVAEASLAEEEWVTAVTVVTGKL
jgi:hypothetical protein